MVCLPGYDIDLLNEMGNRAKRVRRGIVVRTDNGAHRMFLGYHRDPELTGSVWHDGSITRETWPGATRTVSLVVAARRRDQELRISDRSFEVESA